jgi:PIN domain nuclease of toxin-antitoxin system
MRSLLDTHTFLWFVLDDPQLSGPAKSVIIDPANDILISPATYWEIAIKVSKQKLDLQATYDDFMTRGIAGNDFEILPVEVRHTAALTGLPFHHKDPFDRLLISQAMVEQIPIVSVDEAFDAYGITRIW